jgi:hypothetical protein
MKRNKSHKARHTQELPLTASTNGLASSPSSKDDESRPSKRKRDSESHKKNKKKRREAEDDANEDSTLQDRDQLSEEGEDPGQPLDVHLKFENSLLKATRETEQDGTGEASLPQDSPEAKYHATPSDSLLKKVRGYRIGGKNQQKVGFFIEEEVKALENFKVQFCNIHGVEGRTFDAMVQHSERGGDEWPVGTHICTKGDFWNDIYALIPDRDRRSVYRFMRRHFQNTTQKAHDWTPEQDDELIRLHAQHGPKYAHIAKLLGRSDDDVTQRWKNRLQYRATKKTGAWSEAELRAFMRSLEEYRNLLIASSAEPEKAGKDIWEMDLKSISWGSISNGMENSRTRQQCADKWRKISKNIITLRQTIDPNAVFDPVEAAKKHHRWNGVTEGEKSKVYVEDDDDDLPHDEYEETRIPSTTPAIIPKLEFAAEQQAVDLARVAKEASIESSPSRGDIQVDGSYSVEKTKKRKHADAEESEDDDDDDDEDDDAAPSSPISDKSHSEVKKSREEKQERRRKRKEKKERKRREAAETAEEVEGNATITPKEKKHKKHRKSGADGNEVNEPEPPESSKKKSKKEKKKHKKAVQEGDAGVDYTSDIESSMVV